MTQHRNRKRRGNFLWRTGELVSHSSWESYSILYQLAKLLEQLPKYKWWACSRVPQSVQGSQKWKTDLCIAGINIKTCKEMKHYKRICCVGPKKKKKLDWMGREFHSTVEMTVDIKGKRSKWNLKKKGKREDGEPTNAQIHLFSASPYLVAHTFSPLHQPVFTAINLGVAFWPASPA